jgi:hypothetical protein
VTLSIPGLGGAAASTTPNPLDSPDSWDVFVLSGQPSPGIAKVTGGHSPRKLDKKDGHGQSGATVTYTGDKISDFHVTITLTETEDWDAWWVWRTLLAKPPAGAKATALSCSHPALSPLGIDSCLVEDEYQPEEDGETGAWKVVIDFCQYRKPTPSIGTPQGATTTDPANPTPQTEAERQIAALTAQAAALAGP